MRLAILVAGMAMGISGSAFAGQAHKPAAASTAAVVETPADPCPAPEMVDHAINTKGTGTAGRMAADNARTGAAGWTAVNAKSNGSASSRMAMSAEGSDPMTANHAINTKGTGSAGGRMAMDTEGGAPAPADHAINSKGTGATANARMAINNEGTGCNNGKVSPNKHPAGM